MNEFELLDRLQTITNKLNDKQELTEYEYKLLSIILFGLGFGILKNVSELILNQIKEL